MQDIVIEPTQTAQWHALVSEAECAAQRHLNESCESYLVFMLMRFSNRPEMADTILGLELLKRLQSSGQGNHEQVRDIGDQCLLYSGLFPQQAAKRLVRISYFVDLGRNAYDHLHSTGHHLSELFGELVHSFVPMMDVLQAMRNLNGSNQNLAALDALELWQDTASEQARRALHKHTHSSTPIITPADNGEIRH